MVRSLLHYQATDAAHMPISLRHLGICTAEARESRKDQQSLKPDGHRIPYLLLVDICKKAKEVDGQDSFGEYSVQNNVYRQ